MSLIRDYALAIVSGVLRALLFRVFSL